MSEDVKREYIEMFKRLSEESGIPIEELANLLLSILNESLKCSGSLSV